jgi:hypothetical protein
VAGFFIGGNMVEHVSITDGDRHEVKHASTAALNQVLHSDGDGTTSFKFVDFSNLANVPVVEGYIPVITSASVAGTQNPVALDTPLQVEFGAGAVTTNATLTPAGLLTFNTVGQYLVTVFLRYGRTTGVGTAILLNRFLVNGVQSLNTNAIKLVDSDTIVPFSSTIVVDANPGDTFQMEVARDSGGVNNGGLFRVVPTVLAWNSSPTATVVVSKFVGSV